MILSSCWLAWVLVITSGCVLWLTVPKAVFSRKNTSLDGFVWGLMTAMTKESIRSICILRLSALGDVCNTVPTVRALQRQFPKAKITWLVGPAEAAFLAGLEGVSFVVVNKAKPIRMLRQLRRQFAKQRFDVLLMLQHALRATVISLGVPAKRRIGFPRQRAHEFQWLFSKEKVGTATGRHVLDGFMAFAKHLGVADLSVEWNIPVPESDRQWVAQQLAGVTKPRILICPAASKAYKNWTVSGYIAVAEHAQSRGWQVILASGPATDEVALAQAIAAGVPGEVLNLAGETSLKQLYALIGAMDLLVAPDSGPGHMAASQGVPVISIMAHYAPWRSAPYGFAQYAVNTWAENIESETGKSVDDLPWRTRLQDPDAMARIPVARVIAKLDEVMDERIPLDAQ